MGVYTSITAEEIKTHLEGYDLGELDYFEAITEGIENSNYLISTRRLDHEFLSILTLVEGNNAAKVSEVSAVMKHLAHYGLPIPNPRQSRVTDRHPDLQGKPTLLMVKLPGAHLNTVSPEHCRQLGAMLGRFHTIATAYPFEIKNAFDSAWMEQALSTVKTDLSESETSRLYATIDRYQELESSNLPQGLIHGDLFKDNILFKDNALVGVLDFFHIGQDLWLMDLAIALNDWCMDEQAQSMPAHTAAMLEGYHEHRPLESEERRALNAVRQIAAARFALTRFGTHADGHFRKDPFEQLMRLEHLRQESAVATDLL
ncbi:MAG: homoserine kinase type II [Candidatus Azotimanducaceae bacterium]|jgi:homoserine kinase type II|tara:strand:+ start:879 stop:1823 length:945 start_codon:yes stop_codon:yes gene_type:complete